jgi:(-)-germacrene D synthase
MIEHSATEEEAIKEFWKQVRDAWKDVNEECLYPTTIPMPPVMPILNLTRVSEV